MNLKDWCKFLRNNYPNFIGECEIKQYIYDGFRSHNYNGLALYVNAKLLKEFFWHWIYDPTDPNNRLNNFSYNRLNNFVYSSVDNFNYVIWPINKEVK